MLPGWGGAGGLNLRLSRAKRRGLSRLGPRLIGARADPVARQAVGRESPRAGQGGAGAAPALPLRDRPGKAMVRRWIETVARPRRGACGAGDRTGGRAVCGLARFLPHLPRK